MKHKAMPMIAEEQAILGGLMFDHNVYQEISSLGLEAKHFYEPYHGRLYANIRRRILKGSIVDALLIAEDFKSDNAFAELGGLTYLIDLVDRSPPPRYIAKYAALVVGAASARQPAHLRPDRQSEIQHISGALSILVGLAVAYPGFRQRGPISMRDVVEAEIAIKRLPPTTRSALRICDDPVGEATDPPLRKLGERLNELGGCKLMAEVAETVAALDPEKEAHRMSTMSTAWDGVGFWAT